MRISITKLPSGAFLAGGERLNDWAQWKHDQPLADSDFFAGASNAFRKAPRRRLKWLRRQRVPYDEANNLEEA